LTAGRTRKPHEVRRRLIGGSMHVLMADSLGLVCGLVIASFLGRSLGPERFGLFMVATAFVAWVQVVVAGLYGRATIRFVSATDDWRPVGTTVLRLYLLTSIAVMLMLLVATGPIADALGAPVLANYLALLSLDIPLHALSLAHRGLLTGTGAFSQSAYMVAGRWASKTILIVLLVEIGLEVEGAILATIGSSAVALAIGRFHIRPALFARVAMPVREMAGYFAPVFFLAISMRLMARVDLVLLKWLDVAAVAVGAYAAAQYLARVPNLLGASISSLLQSTLVKLRHDGERQAADVLARDGMRMVLAMFPLAALAAGSAADVMGLVYGHEQYVDAAPIFALLVFASIGRIMMNMSSSMLVAADRPAWTYRIATPVLVLSLVGYMLVIPSHHGLGAAVVTLAAMLAGAAAMMAAVYHAWRVAPGIAAVVRTVLITAAAYCAGRYWPAQGVWLIMKLTVAGLAVLVAYILLGEWSLQQLRAWFDVIMRRSTPANDEVNEI